MTLNRCQTLTEWTRLLFLEIARDSRADYLHLKPVYTAVSRFPRGFRIVCPLEAWPLLSFVFPKKKPLTFLVIAMLLHAV